MKQDAKETVAALAASDGNRSAMGVLKPLEEISTNTPLGARLKALMLNGSVRCRGRSAKATGMLACARTAYEFDVDIMSEIDIPTIISKSIKVL